MAVAAVAVEAAVALQQRPLRLEAVAALTGRALYSQQLNEQHCCRPPPKLDIEIDELHKRYILSVPVHTTACYSNSGREAIRPSKEWHILKRRRHRDQGDVPIIDCVLARAALERRAGHKRDVV